MSHHIIEYNESCKSCGATGLYVGLAERDGAAVVCQVCKGTGCAHVKIEYDDFTVRRGRAGVTRVVEVNPGIVIGRGHDGQYSLADFGGMSYDAWSRGEPFPHKSENRAFTCPAWWYQYANSALKPAWKECGFGAFSACQHFGAKAKCWERFDAERL